MGQLSGYPDSPIVSVLTREVTLGVVDILQILAVRRARDLGSLEFVKNNAY